MAMNDVTQPGLGQGGYDQEIQDFYHFVESKRQQGIRLTDDEPTAHCPFGFSYCSWIPVPDLKKYLTYNKITQLLQSLYGKRIHLPVDADFVGEDCLKIFTILLLIQRGDSIQYFVENTLWDKSLPFPSRPANFPNLANSPDDFWPEFEQLQWQLCAHHFKRTHINTRLDKNIILPITKWEKLVESGDSGTICKIHIHPDNHSLRELEDQPLAQASYDPDVFVIKSFDARNPRRLNYYRSEVDAFKTLRCNTRTAPAEIVGFYGSFIQNDTNNILLEFADAGTLEQYFQTQVPPDEPDDIVSFWNSMKGLTKGLANLHTAELSPTQNNTDICYGYHQDLKPSNILVFTYGADSPYRYRFKIADLGLSHFVQTRYAISDVNGDGNPGTRTFGAPENHRAREINPRNMKFAQKSDIWSFACICSVAASWVVGGQNRIERYSTARQQARDDAGVAASDCFHDDFRVLPVVQIWHEKVLVERASRIDYITGRLWPIVLKKAFSEHVGDRSWAEQLHFAMIDLLKPPNQHSPPHTPPEQNQPMWPTLYEEPQDIGEVDPARFPRSDTRSTRTPRRVPTSAYDSPPLTNQQRSSFDQGLPQVSRQSFAESSSRAYVSPAASSSPENSGSIIRQRNSTSPVRYARGSESLRSFDQNNPDRSLPTGERRMPTDSRNIPFRAQTQPQPYATGSSNRTRSGKMYYTPTYHQHSGNNSSSSHIIATTSEESSRHTPLPSSSTNPEDHDMPFRSEPLRQDTQSRYAKTPDASRESRVDENCPRHGIHGKDVEHMSVQELLDWYHKKKEVPHAGLKEDLRKRDHVFVIDDSISMKAHWPQVVQLFAVLAKFIKDCDDDGIELFFTINRHDKMKSKNTSPLIQKVRSLEGSLDASSEPATVLRDVFDKKRFKTLREGKKKYGGIGPAIEAPLTVYILTDGVWQPETDLWPEISEIVKLLEQHPAKGPKHVGIQFIQFGDDPRLTDKLTAYDDSDLARDIVDRESCDGNAWKMLLGSVNTSFDKADAVCTCYPGSRTSSNSPTLVSQRINMGYTD